MHDITQKRGNVVERDVSFISKVLASDRFQLRPLGYGHSQVGSKLLPPVHRHIDQQAAGLVALYARAGSP